MYRPNCKWQLQWKKNSNRNFDLIGNCHEQICPDSSNVAKKTDLSLLKLQRSKNNTDRLLCVSLPICRERVQRRRVHASMVLRCLCPKYVWGNWGITARNDLATRQVSDLFDYVQANVTLRGFSTTRGGSRLKSPWKYIRVTSWKSSRTRDERFKLFDPPWLLAKLPRWIFLNF